MFGIRLRHPVVQTNLKDKTPFIASRHIVYYYGDSHNRACWRAGGAYPGAAFSGFLCQGSAA
jgi:hypothetical protein